MSQRTNGFRGGIQSGSCATDDMARGLDVSCKEVWRSLSEEYDSFGVQRKLRQDQVPGGLVGCEPDGGAWFLNGRLVAVFEGKKQGVRGNAIERWYKNQFVCRTMNPSVCYVTFAVGEGARSGEVIERILSPAHERFNEFIPCGNSCFLSPEGFTKEEIERIMRKVLDFCMENA